MRIWVEAFFVANQPPPLPPSPLLKTVKVSRGSQAADRLLMNHTEKQDIAITADIPLAAGLVARGVRVLHPKGDLFTRENVGQRLSLQEFFTHLRGRGVDTRDSSHYRHRATHRFAALFDRELHRVPRSGESL